MSKKVLALLALCALSLPAAAIGAPQPVVSAFYYPWFGSQDGGYGHWAANGHAPPMDIASNYYPAFGAYSSSNTAIVTTQMTEAERAGIDELAVSWWGKGSPEDQRLVEVIAGANAVGIRIAAHIEPYNGRTPVTVQSDAAYLRTLGIRTIYVYEAFLSPAADWAPVNDTLRADGTTIFAQTALVGQAVTGHFSGIYTYDTVTWTARILARLCNEAHAKGLQCAPSVGPGYDARRAVGDPHVKARRKGATYDDMWHAAIAGGADRITITSFNEWQEGTQIEPAVPMRLGPYRYPAYDGAWGLHGVAAENAYLTRTAYWAGLFRKALARPK